jgi:DNA-cytosine methyltransferase
MHGSPCQSISLAGLQHGADKGSGTRSSLMWETIRIVEKLKPKYVIWENVKNLLSKKHIHNFNAYLETMEQLGYTNYYQVLNAKDYRIPQNRERVFTISIRKDINKVFTFPPKQELKLRLKDMLEEEVDEKYYLSEKMVQYISADNAKWSGNNKEALINKDIATTINTGEGQRRCDASNYISSDVGENYDLKRPERVLKYLIETQQIKELPCCCDSTINEPKVRKISNCITSRYNAGIQNQKQIDLCVVESSIKTITTSGGNDRGVVVK